MTKENALDLTGRVLVDTGVFCLAPTAALALLKAAGVECNEEISINPGLYQDAINRKVPVLDFYREIALALPRSTTKDKYLESIQRADQSNEINQSFGIFFDKWRQADLPFDVAAVPDGEFFHVGTSRDLLTKLNQPSRTARLWNFQNDWRCSPQTAELSSRTARECDIRPVFFNVQGDVEHLQICGPSYVEQCDFSGTSPKAFTLRGDNIVVGWPKDFTPPFDELPRGIGLVFLPLQSDDNHQPIPLIFGISDDNKTTWESGHCLFLNQNIQKLIEAGISPELLWPDAGEHSTWTAHLWLPENNSTTLPYLLAATGVTNASDNERQQAANTLKNAMEGPKTTLLGRFDTKSRYRYFASPTPPYGKSF